MHTLRTKERPCDHTFGIRWFHKFTCSNNFTLSMGATAVFEMAAAMPPAKKSFMKLTTASDMVGSFLCRFETPDWSKLHQRPQGNPTTIRVGKPSRVCPNICAPCIARHFSDGFTFGQTDKRGWINIRGWKSRSAPCSWSQDYAMPGHNKCNLICI